jgi:hypothetical protein
LRPSIQPGEKVEITRSPGLNRVAPTPIASTRPAMSEIGVKGKATDSPMPVSIISLSR